MIYAHDRSHRAWLTLKEAALLAGVSEKAVRHALARKEVRPHREGGKPRFCAREVLFFRLIHGLPFELDGPDRRALATAVVRKGEARPWSWHRGRLVLAGSPAAELDTAPVAREVAKRVRSFLRGKRRVVSRPEVLGGEPVFEGTRVPVRHVGELAERGVTVAELLEDYPSIDEADVEFARQYARLGAGPGRPRKLKFVRAAG